MKKKILSLIILFTLVFGSFYWYSYTSENEKFEILNEIIKDDQLTLFKICSEPVKINFSKENSKRFSSLERLAIQFQNFFPQSSEIRNYNIQYFNKRVNKFKAVEIVKKCDAKYEIIYKISIPIVSPDKKKVLIKITEDCNCMLGGQSGEYFYQKINGKWKRIKVYDEWIS